MKHFILDEAIETLRGCGIIRSNSDFSQDWLGQSESYLRALRFKKAEPSIGAIAICASRLQRAGEQMIATGRYRQLGMRLVRQSEKLHELVNEDAVELELID